MKIFWPILKITMPVVVVLLILTQFILSNELAGYGSRLELSENQISTLQNENKLLYQQLAISNSLKVAENQALYLGFIKTTSFLHVKQDQPVALRE
jgi:hypothetical protein